MTDWDPRWKYGYDDTELIPGSRYRIHDRTRPLPSVVKPGDALGAAPSDAVILFDGNDLSLWEGRDGPARWKVENGYMEVVPGAGNIETREHFGDCQLHIEYAAPAEVKGEGQLRGNSGVILMGLYEIQVLDSYENPTYADGQAAAIYGQYPPLVNVCKEPGAWQTYDIIWFGPRFEDEKLFRPASVTLLHNQVLVHHNRKLFGRSVHLDIYPYEVHPDIGPLVLQEHRGDAVRFRNIWYRPLTHPDDANE